MLDRRLTVLLLLTAFGMACDSAGGSQPGDASVIGLDGSSSDAARPHSDGGSSPSDAAVSDATMPSDDGAVTPGNDAAPMTDASSGLDDAGSDDLDAALDAALDAGPAAISWGTEAVVAMASGDAQEPSVAIDAQGNAVLVWRALFGAGGVWAASAAAGSTTFDSVTRIDNLGIGSATIVASPQIAIAANGDRLVVWRQLDAGQSELWSNRWLSASGWQGAKRASSVATDALLKQVLSFVMDAAGDAALLWSRAAASGTGPNDILLNRFSADTGAWTADECVSCVDEADAGPPEGRVALCKAAMTEPGELWVILERGVPGTQLRLEAKRRSAVIPVWSVTEEIAADVLFAPCDGALDGQDDLFAIWQETKNGKQQISVRQRPESTQVWGTAQTIETGLDSAQGVLIAADANGQHAMAVWEAVVTNQDPKIRASHFTRNVGWATPTTLQTVTTPTLSKLVMNGDDVGVAMWTNKTASLDITTDRFDSSTGFAGAELLGHGSERDVAINASGAAIAVWQQEVPGATFLVHARRTN